MKHILAETISDKLKHKDFGFQCLHYSLYKSVGTFSIMVNNKRNINCKVRINSYDDNAEAGVHYEAIGETMYFIYG